MYNLGRQFSGLWRRVLLLINKNRVWGGGGARRKKIKFATNRNATASAL
jgi:hypothetical protein